MLTYRNHRPLKAHVQTETFSKRKKHFWLCQEVGVASKFKTVMLWLKTRLPFLRTCRSKSAWSWGSACSRRPRRQRGCWCWKRFDKPKTISAVASTTCWWTTTGHNWLLVFVFPNKISQTLLTSNVCSGRKRVQPFSKPWKKIGEQWPWYWLFFLSTSHTQPFYIAICVALKCFYWVRKNYKPQ